MSFSETLVVALVADLESIKVSGGYDTDVRTVSREVVEPEASKLPLIALQPGGRQTAESETISKRVGQGVVTYILDCVVAGSNPHELLNNLFDDICNAVEKLTSAILAVRSSTATDEYYVELIEGIDSSPAITTGDIANQRGRMIVTIDIQYWYVRGKL